MTERLTDEQLREVARSFTEQSIEAAAVNEALALRARVAKLEAALQQSVELQSHYAELLNMHDGGQRLTFANVEAWLDRLAALKDAPR
jgi:hypothetical protein